MRLLLCLLLLASAPVWAGRHCQPQTLSPQEWAAAAASAVRVSAALDAADAEIALLARAGTDLSTHGLHYSHLGFVLRDHPNGRWTVIHLLNVCGSDRSGLFAEGLLNFFADDLASQDARIVWPQPEFAARLLEQLRSPRVHALHQPRYSLIARPDSRDYQNSTGWALELLAAADSGVAPTRRHVQARLQALNFEPDHVHIAYSKRIAGGLFAANLAFTDHPVATRLGGRYPVVTVRAILRHLERLGQIAYQREWRNGVESVQPGPA